MTPRYIFGGAATAIALVLAVTTYTTLRPDRDRDTASIARREKEQPTPVDKEARPAEQRSKDASQARDERGRALADRLARGGEPAPAQKKPDAVTGSTALPLPAPQGAPAPLAELKSRPGIAEAPQKVEHFALERSLAPFAKRRATTESFRTGRIASDIVAPRYEATGRDQFASVAENPVKEVAKEPVSTFSIDVDTASYAFVRRQLNRGILPQKNAVRVEEMVNYFDYDYPRPATRERPFEPSVTVLASPWKDGNKLIHIGIRGYDIDADARPRSNLVFLLDVSGSMNQPDKLPLMVNSMKLLLDQLKPDDTVGIVVYAGAAGTVLEPTKVSEKHKILAALDRLRAGGSTAGAAGIRQAYALAQSTFDKKAVNRVILATDGDFNVGITNRDELKGFVERKRKSGVFLSVLGFGQGNLNDQLMQALAQNGNGVAAHIDTLNEARKVLVEEASSTLFPIAKDVKIQVEFNPATVREYRLVGYETRALKREDFNNDKVDAGDIGAGHKVTAIYEITPVDGGTAAIGASRYQGNQTAAKPASGEHASEYGFLKIRYKLPDRDRSILITTPIATDDGGDGGEAAARRRREARWATAVASFGQMLRGGKYTGAMSYEDVIALAQGAKGADRFGYRAEFINLVRLARSASALPPR